MCHIHEESRVMVTFPLKFYFFGVQRNQGETASVTMEGRMVVNILYTSSLGWKSF